MAKKLVTLHPEQDVFHAIALLAKHKVSGAPVVDSDGKLLGMFTEKCCLQVLVDATYESLPSNAVGSFMMEDPVSVNETTQLHSIAQLFINRPLRRLPVLRDGKLVGQVSRRDVIHHAARMIKPTKEHKSATLYLSALSHNSWPAA